MNNSVWLAKFAPESPIPSDGEAPHLPTTFAVVVVVAVVAIVGVGLLFYFRKRKRYGEIPSTKKCESVKEI